MLLLTSQYAAPGQIVIGEDMQWDEARAFCQQKTGGDLLTVKDQATYDRLATLTQGYTHPVLIGLMSDSAGNWEWADGSFLDLDFLRAHSADQLEGVGENQVIPAPLSWILAVARALTKTRQGVFYPPSYAQDPNAGFHVSRTTTLLSFCLALFQENIGDCAGRIGTTATTSRPREATQLGAWPSPAAPQGSRAVLAGPRRRRHREEDTSRREHTCAAIYIVLRSSL